MSETRAILTARSSPKAWSGAQTTPTRFITRVPAAVPTTWSTRLRDSGGRPPPAAAADTVEPSAQPPRRAPAGPPPGRPARTRHPKHHRQPALAQAGGPPPERRPPTAPSIATAPAPPRSSQRRSPLRRPDHALASAHARDGELDWPALLYAPVGLPRQRPLGLLVIGSRACHWYTQQDIDYAAALGVTLSGLMLSLGGPLTRLSQRELAVARLIAQGLSLTETSAALQVELDAARGL